MNISLSILKKMVNLDGLTPEQIALKLTMASAEIEGVHYKNGHFSTVVTAKLLEVKPHPDSDHLTVVKADTGSEVFNVVCGAPNHKTGDICALALEGTQMAEDFVIKKSKIRGVESCGMLCSEKELGLTGDHSGVIVFAPGTKIGVPLTEIYPEMCDVCLEIDNKSITHRPDLWGHEGFARELAALYDRPLLNPVDTSIVKNFPASSSLKVEIKCPERAPRYTGLVMSNIVIKESPAWLKAAIESIGMRPINNIVDITNYVMAELGQPMHAFSRAKLRGDTIFVRLAAEGEKLTTLDGQSHDLTGEDIVIADEGGAIALAGVMGGGNSEIDEHASEIVLESANFNAVSIRKTAFRRKLRTDAAMRYEKSLDPELCYRALLRAAQLILEIIPGSTVASPVIDAYPSKPQLITIETSCGYIRRQLGKDVADETIVQILTSLGFGVRAEGSDLSITVPSWRATKDVSIAADIVEEIGRIHGFDNIPPVAPFVPCIPPLANQFRLFERTIKSILSGNHNMIEVYNYSFVGESLLKKAGTPENNELRLRNALSVEHDRLRTDLIPGILQNIVLNEKNTPSFKIYEMGRTYHKKDRTDRELATERVIVAGAFCAKSSRDELFYEIKTVMRDLASRLAVKVSLRPAEANLPAYAHPKRTLEMLCQGNRIGLIFEVNPVVKHTSDISSNAALFTVDVNSLFEADKIKAVFRELPKYPDVYFEVSVLADAKVYAGSLCEIVRKSSQSITATDVVAVYAGAPVPEGKKSVSLKITFSSPDKTLSSAEIQALQDGVIKTLTAKGYPLR